MNRRTFNKTLGAVLAASMFPDQVLAAADSQATGATGGANNMASENELSHIAMLVHPAFVTLDLIGPHQFFTALGNVDVHLVWKTREMVQSSNGITIQPTMTLKECPKDLDVLFVPGGLEGGTAIMNDPEILDFLHDRGQRAKYVTSVCTGSLLLGAAGLLRGYRAASHWTVLDLLPLFGAEPIAERVVEDRNRITGGGVTAGIDFGLRVAARLRGEQHAKMLQLMLEYDPQPPFHAGNPQGAGAELTQKVRDFRSPAVEAARKAALEAQKRLQG
jgi:cyclohexyl-isocyanide hydratase